MEKRSGQKKKKIRTYPSLTEIMLPKKPISEGSQHSSTGWGGNKAEKRKKNLKKK